MSATRNPADPTDPAHPIASTDRVEPADPLGETQAASESDRQLVGRTGQRVGRYLVGEPLAQGGMGVVYRGVDEQLGRPVAIKFLARSDDQSRARFLREARAASAIDHPNIGTVYEVGETDGVMFMAMALYEGETLQTRIGRGALSETEVVAITRQLCAALEAAHRAGIVHRDLKPANVMLLPDGTVKLLDFGVAKLVSGDETSLTRDGALIGTIAYMAPEQLRSSNVDARADLWALGAVIHEMLTGEPPFGADSAALVVTRILSESPRPVGGAPRDLAKLSECLLSKRPDQRVSSAHEVARLLALRQPPRPPRGSRLAIAGTIAVLGAGAAAFVLHTPAPVAPPLQASVDAAVAPSPRPDLATARDPAAERKRIIEETARLQQRLLEIEAEEARAGLQSYRKDKRPKMGKQEEARARELYALGMKAYNAHVYPEAAFYFQATYDKTGEPALLYNVAQAYRLDGQPDKARAGFQAYLARVNPKSRIRREIEAYLARFGD